MEYDGADLGYLTTTISFLARYYLETKDDKVFNALKKAISFSSYFIYPDYSYGGFIGSRHTAHFHPTGFEIMSKKIPIAATIKERVLRGIKLGRIITPKIMDDKYFSNLMIEFLQSFIYFTPSPIVKNKLPYESPSFKKYFKESGIFVIKTPLYYAVSSLSKGGVIKVFNTEKSSLVLNDAGIQALTNNNEIVSSHWLDKKYFIRVGNNKISISGKLHLIHSEILTPEKMILSRIGLLLNKTGKFSLFIKKNLIKRLITKSKRTKLKFSRELEFQEDKIHIKDTIDRENLKSVRILDQFASRYVPASRYFQPYELTTKRIDLNELLREKSNGKIVFDRTVFLPKNTILTKTNYLKD
jgi:hypothetical protein